MQASELLGADQEDWEILGQVSMALIYLSCYSLVDLSALGFLLPLEKPLEPTVPLFIPNSGCLELEGGTGARTEASERQALQLAPS